MPISFPTTGLTPNVTTYSLGDLTWIWTGSVWQSVGSVSVQGIQGTQGIQGPSGIQGATGEPGGTGPEGPQGLTGGFGVQGIQGIQGSFGTSPIVFSAGPAAIGFAVQGLTGQTARLIEWRNPSGVALGGIDAAGNLTKGDGDQIILANQVF